MNRIDFSHENFNFRDRYKAPHEDLIFRYSCVCVFGANNNEEKRWGRESRKEETILHNAHPALHNNNGYREVYSMKNNNHHDGCIATGCREPDGPNIYNNPPRTRVSNNKRKVKGGCCFI